jgi:hypothetical protein
VNILLDNPMTQFSFRWILSLNWLCQKWGQVQIDLLLHFGEPEKALIGVEVKTGDESYEKQSLPGNAAPALPFAIDPFEVAPPSAAGNRSPGPALADTNQRAETRDAETRTIIEQQMARIRDLYSGRAHEEAGGEFSASLP